MAVTRIESESLRLEVAPESGASVVALAARVRDGWLPVLRETPQQAIDERNSSLMSCFLLAPWSNRLAEARFVFLGRTFQLRANTPEGYAIHGDVRKRPWRTDRVERDRASFSFASRDFADVNFPFPFSCRLDYALAGRTLTIAATLASEAAEAMPAGLGFHPYYRRTLLDDAEQVEIEAHLARVYDELVPTRPAVAVPPELDFSDPRPLGGRELDRCFAGWDGAATITWPGSGVRARVACEPPLDHVILFAPAGKPFFALEPVSHSNNGFNLAALGDPDAGMRVLEPGASLRAVFRLTIEA
ncbi:MAG: aldose 1-epimerase [Thermodesulfobacteriota bacterium]